MKYSEFHWKLFNFFARRIIAIGFIVVGLVLALYSIPYVLPGGTVLVDGVPSDDLIFRWFAVLFPLVIALLGAALYRVQPYVPPKE